MFPLAFHGRYIHMVFLHPLPDGRICKGANDQLRTLSAWSRTSGQCQPAHATDVIAKIFHRQSNAAGFTCLDAYGCTLGPFKHRNDVATSMFIKTAGEACIGLSPAAVVN